MPNWIDRLAQVQTRVSLVGTAQKTGAFSAYLGPLVGALSQWKVAVTAGLDGRLLWFGVFASLTGAAVSQGAGWILARGRESIDRQHSFRMTAALRAVRQARGRANELRSVQEQLLRCIADTARTSAHSPDVDVVACLLLLQEDKLIVTAYSSFRQSSLPGGAMDLDEPEGAPLACRERKIVCVPDVHLCAHKDRFVGKTYRSLIAFPLVLDNECLAVVAVDSTVSNHFRSDRDEVAVHVLPFVEMLKETLSAPAAYGAAHVAR